MQKLRKVTTWKLFFSFVFHFYMYLENKVFDIGYNMIEKYKTLVKIFLIVFIGLGTATKSIGQKDSSKLGFFPLPILYYTPETEWAFGAATILTFPTGDDEVSQLQFGAAYTLRDQFLSYLPFQLFLKDDQWRVDGELGYYRYTYFYFGIGNGFADYEGENYDVTFPRLRLNSLWALRDKLYMGIALAYDDFNITQMDSSGLLAQIETTGSDGSVFAALGLQLRYDSRDKPFFPQKGQIINAQILRNQDWLGSAQAFWQWEVDWRFYKGIKEQKVWANQVYLTGRSGNPPFNQLALLGGGSLLRGYINGRFRDRQAWVSQTEYRFPLSKRFGAVVFGGLGAVSPSWSSWRFDQLRYNFGLGFRYTILPRDGIRLRLDYGFGQNSSEFYFTVGEAF